MKRKPIVFAILSCVLVAFILAGCAGQNVKPTASNFQDPKITLSHVEVPYYTGYWYFSKKVKPTKGSAGNYGAPMGLGFVFDIENPNNFPVMMEGFKFSIAFEEFELNTVSSNETQWIPPGKTNQLRVNAIMDARSALLSLLVTGGFKLKEAGMSPWDALEKWWTQAPDASYPIYIQQGTAIFSAGDVTNSVAFNAMFP